MPKAANPTLIHDIFPEQILIQFRNDPGATADKPNQVRVKIKWQLLDTNGDAVAMRGLTKIVWSGTALLTLQNVLNQLESRLSTMIGENFTELTGDTLP